MSKRRTIVCPSTIMKAVHKGRLKEALRQQSRLNRKGGKQ